MVRLTSLALSPLSLLAPLVVFALVLALLSHVPAAALHFSVSYSQLDVISDALPTHCTSPADGYQVRLRSCLFRTSSGH